jgi:hypothetical protein
VTTKREDVLAALLGVLETVPSATVLREQVLPEKVPVGGLIILRDGDPGEPEAILSPLTWIWEHRATLDVFAVGATPAERASRMDDLLAGIGLALAADRTLGGRCDWIQPLAPSAEEIAEEGAGPIRAATAPVVLTYASPDPLG